MATSSTSDPRFRSKLLAVLDVEAPLVSLAVSCCAIVQHGASVAISPDCSMPASYERILRNENALDCVKDAAERILGRRPKIGVVWGWKAGE